MNIIFLLIILSLLMAGSFLFLFFRAVDDGQFADCETPAQRILFEDEKPLKSKENKTNGDLNESFTNS